MEINKTIYMIVEIKDIRNTDRVERNIREDSMADIRLLYICESDIDLIEQFCLYLDQCQIMSVYTY